MIINAKCRFDVKEQIEDRTKVKNNKDLEIQLIESLKNYTYEDVKRIIEANEADVNTIHSVLKNSETVILSDFALVDNTWYYDHIYSTFRFAEYIAQIEDKDYIGVIIHGTVGEDMFEKLLKNKIFNERMNQLLKEFPHTRILIENTTLLQKDITGSPAALFEPVYFARNLNFIFETDRFGTVLDICHALGTIRILKKIYNKNINLEDYFENYRDTIGVVHLSYCKKYALGKDHGLPFNEHDKDVLEEIMGLYKQYGYTCPISIEVNEKNNNDAKNFQITKDTLLEVLNEKVGEENNE